MNKSILFNVSENLIWNNSLRVIYMCPKCNDAYMTSEHNININKYICPEHKLKPIAFVEKPEYLKGFNIKEGNNK